MPTRSCSLVLTGENFVDGSQILLGESPLPSKVDSATQMTATVPQTQVTAIKGQTVKLKVATPKGETPEFP